jgi:CMP-2-keto-3-deoxyoctulosonic acid synthetase
VHPFAPPAPAPSEIVAAIPARWASTRLHPGVDTREDLEAVERLLTLEIQDL